MRVWLGSLLPRGRGSGRAHAENARRVNAFPKAGRETNYLGDKVMTQASAYAEMHGLLFLLPNLLFHLHATDMQGEDLRELELLMSDNCDTNSMRLYPR